MNKASIFLIVILLVSSVAVITVRHQNRLKFVYVQSLEQTKDDLQTEWGRLMLEKGTWAVEQNIADDAGDRLGMSPPPPEKIVTVELGGS